MRDQSASPWAEVTVAEVIERHFCGPSPDCEERPVFDDAEWGVLKTTAITWSGWNQDAHKVLPRSYWGREGIEVKAGDVLVTKAGPRHRVAVVTHVPATRPQLVVSGKMIGLRPRSDLVLPQVLAGLLALGGPQKYIHDRTTGMAESQVNFANDVLLATPLRLPPLPEQTEIAQVAGALDTTIRQTEAIVEKLKLVKQGLLHDLLTRGIDANGELRPPQSQAPHLYKASPLGWIPREWEVGGISRYLNADDGIKPGPFGSSIKKESFTATGFKVYGQEQVISGNQEIGDYFIPLRKFQELQDFAVAPGDVLISLVGTIGKVLVLREPLRSGLINPRLMRLRPNQSEALPEFVGLLASSGMYARQVLANAGGGTMPVINKRIVSRIQVPVLSLCEQVKIWQTMIAADRRIDAEQQAVRKLATQKSGLMDDLLTGRVRVTPLLQGQAD